MTLLFEKHIIISSSKDNIYYKEDNSMKKIKLIYTGGTIGGRQQMGNSAIIKDLKRPAFQKYLHEKVETRIPDIKIEIKVVVNKLSEHMNSTDWIEIAHAINDSLHEEQNGIVVVHGTDTMVYTAAAISYMLQGLKQSIILTGSNKPLMDDKTDAVKNLVDAIFVSMQPEFKGVFVVFSGNEKKNSIIHLGTRIKKKFTEDFYSYESVNHEPIGVVKEKFTGKSVKILNKKLLDSIITLNVSKEYNFEPNLVSKVSFFKVFPNFDPSVINYVIKNGTKGIILELYNSGTASTQGPYSLIDVLEQAQRKIPIFATSQHYGYVDMNMYGSAEDMKTRGVVGLKNITTEAAIPKLMWLLARNLTLDDVKSYMLKNMAGEIIESS